MQEITARPSTSTVQAPHSPSPQPSLVPVQPERAAQDVEQPVCAVDLDALTSAPFR